MAFIVSALYAQTPAFDLTYYKDVHMPLALSRLGSYGLQSYQVLELKPEASQGYAVQTIMVWESEEGLQKGFGAHGAELKDDLKNFSDVEPVGLLGSVVAASS